MYVYTNGQDRKDTYRIDLRLHCALSTCATSVGGRTRVCHNWPSLKEQICQTKQQSDLQSQSVFHQNAVSLLVVCGLQASDCIFCVCMCRVRYSRTAMTTMSDWHYGIALIGCRSVSMIRRCSCKLCKCEDWNFLPLWGRLGQQKVRFMCKTHLTVNLNCNF